MMRSLFAAGLAFVIVVAQGKSEVPRLGVCALVSTHGMSGLTF